MKERFEMVIPWLATKRVSTGPFRPSVWKELIRVRTILRVGVWQEREGERPARAGLACPRSVALLLFLADLTGARSCIYIKDENGLYTDDPKKNPRAEFIPEIGAKTLMARDLVFHGKCSAYPTG